MALKSRISMSAVTRRPVSKRMRWMPPRQAEPQEVERFPHFDFGESGRSRRQSKAPGLSIQLSKKDPHPASSNHTDLASEDPRMHHRRFQRLCAALPLLLLAIPDGSRSQEISKQVPVNAQAKPYGTGWECKRGFRQDGVACTAIKLPENAYLSETSYVSGWECRSGYKPDRNSCVAVKVPQNAYLSGSAYGGDDWECERGYRKTGAGCISVIVPKNGYLADSFSFQGRGWNCDRGFRASGNECVAVRVPQNAYLSQSAYLLDSSLTTGWECERGFDRSGDTCLPIEIPRNGYLDTFGRDWKCERGFKKASRDCVSVKLPTNAHLDYSGNDWSCDRPFRRQNDSCVLSQ